jgi:lon-related putative ATP-dependent protease
MAEQFRLNPEELTSPCNIDDFSFNSTADLEPLKGIIGQERAVEALEFGLRIRKKGYNMYISGISGTGRSSYANSITEKLAGDMPVPNDWVYVFNFKNPDRPRALSMEAGLGLQFKKDIEQMILQLRKEIPIAFAGTDYEAQRSDVYRQYQQMNQDIMNELNKKAEEYGFAFQQTEHGLATVPLIDGRQMNQEEYAKLTPEEIEEIRVKSNELSLHTLEIFNKLKGLEEKVRESIRELDEKIGYNIINYYINKLIQRYGHRKENTEFFNDLERDIVENLERFKKKEDKKEANPLLMMQMQVEEVFFNRYKVNLFVNNAELSHAPIINEPNPNFYNLHGTIEYKNEMGVMKTDFMQIKPGALHMANGGFLVIHAKEILMQPYAWETLKRALKTREINIESLNKQMGYVITSTLKPEPVPIDLKVILIGDAQIYSLLYTLDEDFNKLFKVMADFDVEMIRSEDNVLKMAKFIAAHCQQVGLKHFDKTAIARVVEYSSRLADHQNKLSSRFNQIVEVLYEADAWAEAEGAEMVSCAQVEKAIEKKIYRNSKYEEKLNEMFKDGTLLIDVDGEKIGQINGLAVMGTGEYSFGKPSRITVSTYQGKPGIINIEREVRKSGSIHDKGVLILSGYMGCKYAQEEPISLSVSISFEQNYSLIEGDSASSTELYAILSSIAQVPIKQYIAVTGSVNQKGEIQPIGGVNEKIEGFYDVCKLKGLTGKQGIMIPKQNVKNLMLKQEVINAIKDNQFHIYAICHVDEGIEILTGLPAGEQNEKGEYPEGTMNYLITQRLKALWQLQRDKMKNVQKEGSGE